MGKRRRLSPARYRLPQAANRNPRRANEIVLGKRRATADTALRLAKYFNMSPEFWLGIQMDYDLDIESDRLGDRLNTEVTRYSRAHVRPSTQECVAERRA